VTINQSKNVKRPATTDPILIPRNWSFTLATFTSLYYIVQMRNATAAWGHVAISMISLNETNDNNYYHCCCCCYDY